MEFKAVKKMLPIFEVKQAYVPQINAHFANYLNNGNSLCNFVVLGRSIISGSAGITYGPDFMAQGVGDGTRIGNRISVKKLTLDVHINIDGQFTDSSARPGPYIFKWWIYRTKGTLNGASEGGLTANNTDWSQWFDEGNDTYAAPLCTQTDLYNSALRMTDSYNSVLSMPDLYSSALRMIDFYSSALRMIDFTAVPLE